MSWGCYRGPDGATAINTTGGSVRKMLLLEPPIDRSGVNREGEAEGQLGRLEAEAFGWDKT